MSGDGFHQANGMLNVLISLSNALRTLTNMGMHAGPAIDDTVLASNSCFFLTAGSVGFHNALTEIQKTANRDPIRASVVKMRSWIALMDRLAALHSSGRTLIHPKILKLVEVGPASLVVPASCVSLLLTHTHTYAHTHVYRCYGITLAGFQPPVGRGVSYSRTPAPPWMRFSLT